MASIKVKFRPSAKEGREGTIYYQIIHERTARQLISDYHVMPSEWDAKRSMVIDPQREERKVSIMSIRQSIRWDMERFRRIMARLERIGLTYSADDIVEEFRRYATEYSLFNFMENHISRLRQNGKIRTSETYMATLRSFKSFRNEEDIMLDCLTSEVMEAYEAWHRKRGISPNTISFYMRILRATYNRAVEEELIENRKPFRRVYTGIGKTRKRALSLGLIKRICGLTLVPGSTLDFARDMFLMSFYLRGMSFVDMAYLRKKDLVNGRIIYRRRKTGRKLAIAWTKEMQTILEKYPENKSAYLLPILTTPGCNELTTYRNVGYRINRSLKFIAGLAGVTIPLTLYVARHSWASAAQTNGIPLSVISEGMGHGSELTTRIYLASLDNSVVDNANNLILRSVR